MVSFCRLVVGLLRSTILSWAIQRRILLCAVQEHPLKALASGVARHLVGELGLFDVASAERVA